MTENNHLSSSEWRRHALFLSMALAFAAVFRGALRTVLGSALSVDQYSHILLVVPVSAALLYINRKRLLANPKSSKAGGAALIAVIAAYTYFSRGMGPWSESGFLSLSILCFVLCCLAAFLLCYGKSIFRRAAFPLLFLILMVPLPDSVLDRTVALLQEGSAETSCALFSVAHVPYVRHDVVISLPKIDIEIAEECSGIRSSLILFLSSLVLGHLFLESGWTKTLLTLAVFPITVAKNGLRIFILSMLGMYVDPSFLSGKLHRDGGILFFALAFASLGGVIWLLQKLKIEAKLPPQPEPAEPLLKASL